MRNKRLILRARAFRDGWDKSAVVEAVYLRDAAGLTDAVAIRAEANSVWDQVKGPVDWLQFTFSLDYRYLGHGLGSCIMRY